MLTPLYKRVELVTLCGRPQRTALAVRRRHTVRLRVNVCECACVCVFTYTNHADPIDAAMTLPTRTGVAFFSSSQMANTFCSWPAYISGKSERAKERESETKRDTQRKTQRGRENEGGNGGWASALRA